MTLDPQRLEQIQEFLSRNGLELSSFERVVQALTHRSYAFEHDEIPDNERLEFLGDAVLGCLAADLLFQRYPTEPEGDLSKKRAFLVSRLELGRRGRELGLSPLLLLGRGEENSGGRRRDSILGSALEACIGALYFEVPFEVLRRFVWDKVLTPGLESLEAEDFRDYKSLLQELVQKQGWPVPEYAKTAEQGPPHDKQFAVEVRVAGQVAGRGQGGRIKTAGNRAARQAYRALLEGSLSLPVQPD